MPGTAGTGEFFMWKNVSGSDVKFFFLYFTSGKMKHACQRKTLEKCNVLLKFVLQKNVLFFVSEKFWKFFMFVKHFS
jgi:hypothetical protein